MKQPSLRNWKILLPLALIIAAGIYFAGRSVQAGGPEPGSNQDPLVTKSYVDNYIDSRTRELQGQLDNINKQIAELEARITALEQRPVIKLTIGSKTAYVGSTAKQLPVAPYQTGNGTSMVPFRFIGEALGAKVDYNEATQTVSYTTATHSVILKIGTTTGTFDGRKDNLPAPATLVNGTTMVPVRVISQGLGARVDWDQATLTITIRP
ncbi:Copper amine oxidase-like, N-terminal [Moorella glycerini]|uniref:Copper amine oxidase-like N-terminal domain-containing protein n=1 Tax=Neomoorella stamsii TaxID=1266720 RepID=A0A9X7J0L8_9FIRM|nr:MULTISPECIES: copper amine oxidase N-terminal domain-containing protein [Moorella]PRR69997.1 hypothetical protein MOST_28740 [Moorella stamsii]CEP68452.1 Copper amine oxidase-like, N-terminal [Moorella glycerini]